jgi:hypothetical protein
MDEEDGIVKTRKDLMRAFGWSQTTVQNLPSKKAAETDEELWKSKPQAWSAMRQSIMDMTIKGCEIVYPKNSQALLHDVATSLKGEVPESKLFEKLLTTLINAYDASPAKSAQWRLARSVLVKGLPRKYRKELSSAGRLKISGSAQTRAWKDMGLILEGCELIKSMASRRKVDEEIVKDCVAWILTQENVCVFSWGVKHVRLSENEVVILPRVTRRKLIVHLYKDYVDEFSGQPRLGRTSFYEVVKAVTSGEEKIFTAVDYVTGVLVHDTMDKLQTIIEDFSTNDEVKKELTRNLELWKNFLKHQYDHHIWKCDDQVDTHGIDYGLRKLQPSKETEAESRDGPHCAACRFNLVVFKQIEDVIRSSNKTEDVKSDACSVLNDIMEKHELYRAHRVRVANQQRALQKLNDELKRKCEETKSSSTRAIIVIDWKMKFEAKSSRETSQQHFAKRGIGWHGCLVRYYAYENGKAVRKNVYIDQILEGSNKQDGPAVASMVEAALCQIKKELPFIEEVIIQSDNAGCYQSKQLILAMLLISGVAARRSGIRVERFIHTETQDGKGDIDAHFARATAHLINFMKTSFSNRIRAIATPKGLAAALAWRGGIKHSCVQLISLDRSKLDDICKALAPVVGEMKKYFSRANEIIFEDNAGEWVDDVLNNVSKLETVQTSFNFRAFAYSGIGEGCRFNIDIRNKAFCPNNTAELMEDTNEDNIGVSHEESDSDSQEPENDYELDREGTAETSFTIGGETLDVDQQEHIEANAAEDEESEEPAFGVNAESLIYEDASGDSLDSFTGVKILKRTRIVVDSITSKRNRVSETIDNSVKDVKFVRSDVVAVAVRCAGELIHSRLSIRDGKADMEEYAIAANVSVPDGSKKRQGWAWRPNHGKVYGATYIEKYREDIQEMYNQGAMTESDKMSPAFMLEKLKLRYPGRYSLPGENEIRTEISSLFSKQKSGKTGRRTQTPQDYLDLIVGTCEEAYAANNDLKLIVPRIILEEVKRRAKDKYEGVIPTNFPADQKIKCMISGFKTQMKAKQKTNYMLI